MSGQKDVNTLLAAGRYYYNGRITFLELSLMFLLAWIIFGFDSGIAGSLGNGPIGMGFHWSTLLSITSTIYILLVNYHVNGIKTLSNFTQEFKRDLKHVFRWTKKHRLNGRLEYNNISNYNKTVLGPVRALVLSVCVAVIALFVFELPWAFFYNYFQFGDIWYPIYYLNGEGMGLYRNFALLFGALYCYIILDRIIPPNIIYKIVFVIRHIQHINFKVISVMLLTKNKYKISYRWKGGLTILLLAALCFGLWIYTPQPSTYLRHHDDSHLLIGDSYNNDNVLPKHKLFPQTIYTYYNTKILEPYTMDNIGAYWVNDSYIHFLNVLTKTLVFIGITYLFSGVVSKKY